MISIYLGLLKMRYIRLKNCNKYYDALLPNSVKPKNIFAVI